METFWHKLRLSKAWNYKAPLILAAVYLVSYRNAGVHSLPFIVLAICTILGIAGIGYLLNDLGDRKSDRLAGKPNFFLDSSLAMVFFSIILTAFLAFVPWLYFPADEMSYWLLGGEIFAFAVYALPPFRLKKIRFLAPILDSTYAHVIPVGLAAYTFMLIGGDVNYMMLILMGSWQFFYGFRAFVNHLFIDRGNDIMSYPTLATKGNPYSWSRILTGVSLVEIGLFGTIIWLYLPVWTLIVFLAIALNESRTSAAIYSFRTNVLDRLYLALWPMLVLVSIALESSVFWGIFVLHFLLFIGLYQSKWSDELFQFFRQIGSKLVNHSILFFRRFVLWQSQEQARREYYGQFVIDQNNQKKMKDAGTITLANLNKNKYSETYIQHYKHVLPFAVDFLHGGYPPTLDEQDNRLGKGDEISRDRAIIDRLKSTRSRLILAHFGPMAVSMMPYAKATGVPLVAYFHAYDIHHKKQLSDYQNHYTELFELAHLLLASSQEIADKLIRLGAPESKVQYLPAYFPVQKFLTIERQVDPMKILSVGRFSDTKSPHTLLLAFQHVVAQIPDAKLVMVGEGKLLESSMTLARALKLEDKVEFKGRQSPDEVEQHLASARIFVQHSITTLINHDKEGTPVAIMEALAAGLPVISTNHAGIAELIDHGKSGLLVEELDYEAMAIEIVKCLKSPEYCDQIGVAAKKSIKRNSLIMDHTKIITKIIEDYGLSI